MKTQQTFLKALILGAVVSGAAGCLSMQNQPAVEALQDSKNAGSRPFVEAYVEYRGPQEKWAGPTSFLLHVTAKDAGQARIAIMPAIFGAHPAPSKDPKDGTMAGRGIASQGMAGEVARNHLNAMAQAIQGGEEPYRGCLSPVKVRLIRADGIVLEKQGCRGQTGWPKAASEAVNQFILALSR